jgi:hypothetical protein
METQLAVLHCDAEPGEVPWDCVRIDKIHDDGTFDATNLEPYNKEGYLRRNQTWPERWFEMRFVPAKFYAATRGRKRLLEKEIRVSLDSIQFSTFLTKGGKIKQNMQKHVMGAISACEKGMHDRDIMGLDDVFDDDVE